MIYERLDRVFANTTWLRYFRRARLRNLPIMGSDHGPMLIDTLPGQRRFNRNSKYEAFWSRDRTSHQIVHKVWAHNSDRTRTGGAADYFSTLLKIELLHLRRWHDDSYGNLDKRIQELSRLIQRTQLHIHRPGYHDWNRSLCSQLDHLLQCQDDYWRQRSKLCWLGQGDRNTHYFHHWATKRQAKNWISDIKDHDDQWVHSEDRVQEIMREHYQQFYSYEASYPADGSTSFTRETFLQNISTRLTEEHKQQLDTPFTAQEIKTAVFQMAAWKSPAHDGIPAGFFQTYWPIVQDSLISSIMEFFRHPVLA